MNEDWTNEDKLTTIQESSREENQNGRKQQVSLWLGTHEATAKKAHETDGMDKEEPGEV